MPEHLPLVVIVTWRDAHFDLDPSEPRDDYVVHTVGYLVEDGPKFVGIAGELLPDGEGFRAVTRVPVEMVLDREVIKPVPTMSLMTSVQGGQA